ncbi:MAG TPA: hypothetical protein VFK21_05090 [Gammaproteobacteria bacterium]|nr:hypothetical protein [Gammaproteobacteria bacterium]
MNTTQSRTRSVRHTAFVAGCLIAALVTTPALADGATSPYPAMAPLAQYQSSSQAAEIALAKSAAPASVSDHADVMVLGSHGYETVAKGTNGFVCLVFRSWDMSFDNPEFWNPKIRTPQCINAVSARSVSFLPRYLTRTEWVLAGVSLAEMQAREAAEWKDGRLTPPLPGGMVFMLSKQQYINDSAHPWHPHVMFVEPRTQDSQWGANIPGSPVQGDSTNVAQTSIFMVLVAKWSDGTMDPAYADPGQQSHRH